MVFELMELKKVNYILKSLPLEERKIILSIFPLFEHEGKIFYINQTRSAFLDLESGEVYSKYFETISVKEIKEMLVRECYEEMQNFVKRNLKILKRFSSAM